MNVPSSIYMKGQLGKLVSDNSIGNSNSAPTLLLAVLLKYGIAPIACIYLGYIVLQKDVVIQKNNEQMVTIVREQTVAMTKQTQVQEGLITVIKELKETWHNKRND